MAQPFIHTSELCWSPQELEAMACAIESCFLQYQIRGEVVGYDEGATFALFKIELGRGIKASQVTAVVPELCRSLSAVDIKIIDFIAGTPYIGLRVTNTYRRVVPFVDCFNLWSGNNRLSSLSVMLGEDIIGEPVGWDLAQMPHLLIAGVTRSGKSMLMHSLVMSILYRNSPDKVRFVMFDTSQLELSLYNDIPHLLFPSASDFVESIKALTFLVNELKRRQKLFGALNQRNLSGYNKVISSAKELGRPIPDPFWRPNENYSDHPYLDSEPEIVVCVDDYVQLIGEYKQIGEMLVLLSQQGHAVGIHLILTTRSPLSTSIGSQLRTNIPTRIALSVSSRADSNLILDQYGAESLFGLGDMLFASPSLSEPTRIQGTYVSDSDIRDTVDYCKRWGSASYLNFYGDAQNGDVVEEELDPLFDQATEYVVEKQRVSISGIQRQFRIGYNRAAMIVEQLELQGIVSEQGHHGNREVLAPPYE
ncbi:DNA translocase FtsK [Providencia rettgeri]|uniref:DNA translocase FtsK n=1 Tax=Providencia rettgeri TaxID=587 RepID=UPI001B378EEB|nr:DNA translocase FtsK [Providencia rettgeri]MBQ0436819.1 cell division protein FtsK [Providencia rettgeri]